MGILTTIKKRSQAIRRAKRVRARIHGTAEIPRLSVMRSAKHIYAQLIDDSASHTLVSLSDKDIKADNPTKVASEVGKQLAIKAKEAGITKVVFDRGAYRYHGRVAALAEAARENGLDF